MDTLFLKTIQDEQTVPALQYSNQSNPLMQAALLERQDLLLTSILIIWLNIQHVDLFRAPLYSWKICTFAVDDAVAKPQKARSTRQEIMLVQNVSR